MKKLITLILAFIMLPVTAFASSADMLCDILKSNRSLTSTHTRVQEEIKLNRPLEIFECIPDFDLGDTDIDLAMLSNSLASAKSTMDISCSMSDDLKKGDISMQMEFDTPIRFNDNFTLTAWTKIGLWMTYDLTTEGNYVFKVIADIPFMKKYQVLDMSAYFNENPNYVKIFDKALVEAVNENATKALIGNADLKKSGNKYVLSFTDEGAKAYVLEILELSKQYARDIREEKLFDSLTDNANDFFAKTTVLGEEGMTFETEVNSRGYITAHNISINIALNVYDILQAYSKNTEGLDREKSYIDITAMSAYELSGHNKTVVDIPEITEENSDITEFSDVAPSIEYGHTAIYENPVFVNNTVYYPLNEIDEKCKIEVAKNGDTVTISDTASNVTITASLTDNQLVINGNEQQSDIPSIIEKDGKLYALRDVLSYANIDIYSSNYSIEDESFVTFFEYTEIFENPDEVFEEYEEEYEYIPYSLHYFFDLNRALYTKDYAAYMPIYEFLNSICSYSGEFTFPENGLVFKTDGENVLKIKEVSAYTGDAFVTINGEQKPLNGYVEICEGVMQIPVSFADDLGFSTHISTNYTRGLLENVSFFFKIENPEYEDEYEDYYPYIPETLNYYVNSDRVPYIQDGVLYMPIYDFLKELFEGEFTFYENGFEYAASGENDFGISKVTVYTGDGYVAVDDKTIELDGNVISIDDVMRVPVSFAQALGLTAENVSVFYGTTYRFSKPNPEYMGEHHNYDPIYNNWWYSLF